MSQKRKSTGANAISQGPPSKKTKSDSRPHAKPTKTTFTFQPRPDWHAAELPKLALKDVKTSPPQYMIDAVFERATKLLQQENDDYNSAHLTGSASHKFLSTIMASGTLEDKISALTLLVQESPLHTMKAFDNLLGLSRKKSRNQALMAVAALKDLLGQGTLLPADRKLRAFNKQPALFTALDGISSRWKASDSLPGGLQNVHIIAWAFEDWLKKKYFELLQVLESWCGDEVAFARSRAITYVWELLKDKPEQEENLLRLLVNKLGDTDRKIASRASYLLLQLETSHPAMKAVITNSIEADCLFRPGQSTHAKYYAIVTLNQTVLSGKEEEVANKLLEIYFSLFVQLLNDHQDDKPQPLKLSGANSEPQGGGGKAGKMAAKKRKVEEQGVESLVQAREKLLAQVLTGVNRAFPFADTSNPQFENQINTLFRVTHSANFNTAVQALMLLQQISSTKQYGAERFYRTLYESLLDPRLASSSKQVMYLNLLYKSLKADVDVKRVQAFVKRLLQIINMHDPAFVCSVLYLISELAQSFPSIKKMLTEPEIDDEDEEEHFYDAPEDGDEPVAAEKEATSTTRYDARKRDPVHAHAELTALWDIIPVANHYHPSVAVFAQAIQEDLKMPPKPDPAAHSLMHFLDRFVYRNAKTKSSAGTHGASIMQPSAGSAAADLLVKPSGQTGYAGVPVNSEAFWAKKVQDVAPDQIFFHAYFNQSGNKKRKLADKAKKSKQEDSDEDDAEDDEGEEEIWQAIANSKPEVEGVDSDDDISIGDLESAYSDSDDGSEMGIDLGGDSNEDGGEEMANDFDAFDEELEGDVPALESDNDDAVYGDDDEVAIDLDDENSEAEDNKSKSQKKRKDKKKFKQLPTFASAEDYAKLLGGDSDDE